MEFNARLTNLVRRSRVIQAVRDFFTEAGYLEVDTPVRNREIIPERFIDPMMSEGWYLQASPELCMKRLLCRGSGNIFQIGKVFRKNERSPRHLPEFTLLEWYTRHASYLDLMDQVQALIRYIADRTGTGRVLSYQDHTILLDGEWQRISVAQAFLKYGRMPLEQAMQKDLYHEIMGFEIEPCLGTRTPCFLYDYPASEASLSRLTPGSDLWAQRMEFYIAGLELANGFTELTDRDEQRRRFEKEVTMRKRLHRPAADMPEKFLSDLERMPPAAGIALGLDRLVMLFCDAGTIDDVVSFTPEML